MSHLPMSIRDHWVHFLELDVAPNAPVIQVNEMRRAFYAGAASGLEMAVACVLDDKTINAALDELERFVRKDDAA